MARKKKSDETMDLPELSAEETTDHLNGLGDELLEEVLERFEEPKDALLERYSEYRDLEEPVTLEEPTADPLPEVAEGEGQEASESEETVEETVEETYIPSQTTRKYWQSINRMGLRARRYHHPSRSRH